jgi:hypothetical protein
MQAMREFGGFDYIGGGLAGCVLAQPAVRARGLSRAAAQGRRRRPQSLDSHSDVVSWVRTAGSGLLYALYPKEAGNPGIVPIVHGR